MLGKKTKNLPKNILSKAQNKLLKNSLKLLFGKGLIDEKNEIINEQKRALILKNALIVGDIDKY